MPFSDIVYNAMRVKSMGAFLASGSDSNVFIPSANEEFLKLLTTASRLNIRFPADSMMH
jgi:hypothetical protein